MMYRVASLHGDDVLSDMPIQTGPSIGVQSCQNSLPQCSEINVVRPTGTYCVHVGKFRQD